MLRLILSLLIAVILSINCFATDPPQSLRKTEGDIRWNFDILERNRNDLYNGQASLEVNYISAETIVVTTIEADYDLSTPTIEVDTIVEYTSGHGVSIESVLSTNTIEVEDITATGSISANTSTRSCAIYGKTTNPGLVATNYGVYGESFGTGALVDSNYGGYFTASGESGTTNTGVYTQGRTADSSPYVYGLYATTLGSDSGSSAIYGQCNTTSGSGYGLQAIAQGAGTTNYGIHGSATGATTNWAGYFSSGDVYVTNTLEVGADLEVDKIVGKTGNPVTVGDSAYDRFEITDANTAKSCFVKSSANAINWFWNAFTDGTLDNYDTSRHAWRMYLYGSDTSAYVYLGVAQPTAGAPSFTELMRLTEGGYLKVGGAEALKTYTYTHTLSAAEAAAGTYTFTVTAVTLAKIRSLTACFYDVGSSNVHGHRSLSASATVGINVYADTTTAIVATFGSAAVENDTISITIIVAE